jgi:hypothetical protein
MRTGTVKSVGGGLGYFTSKPKISNIIEIFIVFVVIMHSGIHVER